MGGLKAFGRKADWVLAALLVGLADLLFYGERIGSPVDLDLSVFDARGERELLHWTDGLEDRGVGEITTNHCDPGGRWVVPAEGSYLILIRNVIGGPSHDPRRLYRLSVRREEADFQLSQTVGLSGGLIGRAR